MHPSISEKTLPTIESIQELAERACSDPLKRWLATTLFFNVSR